MGTLMFGHSVCLCKLFYRHKCSTITIIPLIILFIRGQFSLCVCRFSPGFVRSVLLPLLHFHHLVCVSVVFSFLFSSCQRLYEGNIFRFYTLYNVFNVRVYHTTTNFHIKCARENVIGRGFSSRSLSLTFLARCLLLPYFCVCVCVGCGMGNRTGEMERRQKKNEDRKETPEYHHKEETAK